MDTQNGSDLWLVIYFNEARQQRESTVVEAATAGAAMNESEAEYALEARGRHCGSSDEVEEVYAYSETWGVLGYGN